MNDRIKRVTGIAAGAVALGVLTGPPVVAAITTHVDVNDARVFTPKTVSIPVGGSVHWAASGVDDHSVTQDDLVFDTGAPRPGITLTKKFSAGTYPYHCRKHGVNGGTMKGTVKVAPQAAPAPSGLAFTVKWATAGTNTGNSFDVMYRVGGGAWKTWRNNTSAKSMVFGKGGPVTVARGKSYSFKVRSSSGASESLFSPVTTFRAS
jgi:plastocyanin